MCIWKAGVLSSACVSLYFELIFHRKEVEAISEQTRYAHACCPPTYRRVTVVVIQMSLLCRFPQYVVDYVTVYRL